MKPAYITLENFLRNTFITLTVILLAGCTSLAEIKTEEFINKNTSNFEKVAAKPSSATNDPFLENQPECTNDILRRYHTITIEDLERSKTEALLIYKNDAIVCKYLDNKVNSETLLNSWSVAKSITSILVGIAIENGYITSISDPITKYIPELSMVNENFNKISIGNLLEMRSGIDFNEDYFSLNSDISELFATDDITRFLSIKRNTREPDSKFMYSSLDTQLVGIALEKSSGMRLSEFASHYLWKKMDAYHDAYWLMDNTKKYTKSFCCFKATLGDYLRFSLTGR